MAAVDSSSPNSDITSLDDRDLVRAIAAGQAEGVAELYTRYSSMLLGLAQRILGNPADAEEVLQESLLQVWRQASRYDSKRSSVSTWLVLITRSRSIDRLRSRRVKQRTAAEAHRENPVIHESPTGAKDVLRQEQRKRLQRELEQLSPEQIEAASRLARDWTRPNKLIAFMVTGGSLTKN